MQALSLLALFGAAQSFALAIASQAPNKYRTRASVAFTLIMAIETIRLSALFLFIEYDLSQSALVTQFIILRLVFAPLFYVFFCFLLDDDFQLRLRHLAHLLPFFLGLMITSENIGPLYSIPDKIKALIIGGATAISFLSYGIYMLRGIIVNTDKQFIKENGRPWLKVVSAYLIISGLVFLSIIFGGIWITYDTEQLKLFVLLHSLVLCYLITIAGIHMLVRKLNTKALEKNSNLSSSHSEGAEKTEEKSAEKYSNSSMTASELEYYYQKIVELLEKDKIYLKHGLKITDLAEETGLHVPQISQIINQQSDMGFSDFIAKYRVEEVKKGIIEQLAEGGSKANITELAENAGFNSHSTFYKYFKKYVGETPKQYIKEISKS